MLDIDRIKTNKKEVETILNKRNIKVDLNYILELDGKRHHLQMEVQSLREQRNKVSRLPPAEARVKGKEIKVQLKNLEPQLDHLLQELNNLLKTLPNDLHPQVPTGKDESENKVIRTVGEIRKFSFTPLDHTLLAKKLNIIDFDKASKVTGSNFYFFKNELVELELALVKYAMDLLKSKGFTLFTTPDISKNSILEGIGFQPKGPETQVYNLEGTDLSLIGTAEVTLGGYHASETVDAKNLPLKYAGISHCFRTEAGGYGRESRGLYRVHQFTKVEMFIYCLPQDSDKMHEYLLAIEEEIYRSLGLPYRVVDIASGDLGAPAYRKFDLEVWLPGMKKWGEVTSTSNCTDYQSSRLKIKYRHEGQSNYLHTLNGTAVTSSRLPIALLENYQQEDGSIKIPSVLHKYLNFKSIGT